MIDFSAEAAENTAHVIFLAVVDLEDGVEFHDQVLLA